jgi:MOSC domain-containing protein YiiM
LDLVNNSFNHGSVVAVCLNAEPGIPKIPIDAIQLIENFGIAGDYHAGEFVRHRYLANKDPAKPNYRQVLLIYTSILAGRASQDIHLRPGMMGENIILDGVTVMSLPIGTQLEVGESLLEVTEVRNPCYQLNEMHPRLLEAVKNSGAGHEPRNAGMLARVLNGGWVRPGDSVVVQSETAID